MGVRQAWSVKIPAVNFPLSLGVSGDLVAVASSDGTVAMIDARAGREVWRANVGEPLLAGVGSDGSIVAVVTANSELIALQGGKVLWKQRLTAQAFTAPLVAGRRIFVQTADRTTSAWDGQGGRRIWSQQRTAENLVLKRSGVLLAVGDTLVVGIGGRLVGINPANGTSRWESPIAAPRGTNDVERLVDLDRHREPGRGQRLRPCLFSQRRLRRHFARCTHLEQTSGGRRWRGRRRPLRLRN